MTKITYLVQGFHRKDFERKVSILIDGDEDDEDEDFSPHDMSQRIAGPAFRFHATHTVSVNVPDDCKGVLIEGDEELYRRVPELNPRRRKQRKPRKESKPRKPRKERKYIVESSGSTEFFRGEQVKPKDRA
jgi:hypothetical protein